MKKKRLFEAVATLVGCTIGAGVLGIPYVIAQAGFLTGLLNIIVIGAAFLIINLCLGEITLRTKGRHQLVAYAEKYTGKLGKYFMFISTIVGIYGAIIAYIIGGGIALSSIFGLNELFSSIVFFCIIAYLIYLGLNVVEESEAFVMPLILIIIAVIVLAAIGRVNPSNLNVFSLSRLFLPFGVITFAMMGTSAVPEMREELEKNKKELKKAILLGTLIPIAIYTLFAFAIVGVNGINTQQIGSLNLQQILGDKFAFIGELFAILAMSTSFLALGLALKEMFWYDYGLRKNTSWLLTCIVPLLLFLLIKLFNLANFVSVIEITGIISGVITGILVIIININAKKKCERKPEYSVFMNKYLGAAIIIILLMGGIFKLIM